MAGFFGLNNYSKPGPGISKDIGEKKSPILFLEIYFRKFWKLIQAYFLFILACIPFFIPLLVFILMRLNSLPFFDSFGRDRTRVVGTDLYPQKFCERAACFYLDGFLGYV